jgi:outer membrane lipoprotein-sorting protein
MLGKKWIALLAVGSVLALFATACGGSGSKKSDDGLTISSGNGTPGAALPPGVTPISTPSAPPTPVGSPAPESDIQSIADNYAKVKSFRVSITQTSGTQTGTTNLEIVQPDKLHLTVKTPQGQNELICLDKMLYSFQDGKWTKTDKDPKGNPVDCAAVVSGTYNTKAVADNIKQASDAKQIAKGGTDTVNGKKCQIYTQTNSNGSTVELCVADGLLSRVVDKTGGATILFSDYNANIDIKAPI